jgi:hypothetical protein
MRRRRNSLRACMIRLGKQIFNFDRAKAVIDSGANGPASFICLIEA